MIVKIDSSALSVVAFVIAAYLKEERLEDSTLIGHSLSATERNKVDVLLHLSGSERLKLER
jgi:hypothetical protein